jgi:hypothetical protein
VAQKHQVAALQLPIVQQPQLLLPLPVAAFQLVQDQEDTPNAC